MKKEILEELMEKVVFPFSDFLEESEEGRKFLDDDAKKYQHRLDLALLSVALLTKPEFAQEKLAKAAIAHNEMSDLSFDAMQKALSKFFSHMLVFLDKHGQAEEFEKNLDAYNRFFMEAYKEKKVSEDEEDFVDFDAEDDFFDFESDMQNSEINSMHYEESKKISAEEFMSFGELDAHLLDDVKDTLEHFDNMTLHKESVDREYLMELGDSLGKFSSIFNLTHEFKDIGYALETLQSHLDENILQRTEDELRLIKMLFDSVIEDLQKWATEVLEEQSAIDIHYLDASLFANVSQIEITLKS